MNKIGMNPVKPLVHVKALSQHPQYPERDTVANDEIPWFANHEDYSPAYFVHQSVIEADRTTPGAKWADPEDHTQVSFFDRKTFMGRMIFDSLGRPLNPVGRTGLCGRGLLGKWGPNHAADPIVTRPKSGAEDQLQVIVVQRKDTGEWALPGGMVDDGESVSLTVRREFEEECGAIEDPQERSNFMADVAKLFETGKKVYTGYVDDPRNTDNAWMETTAFSFHCSKELGDRLALKAGDDAQAVTWIDVSEYDMRFVHMYADHRKLIDAAAKHITGHTAKQLSAISMKRHREENATIELLPPVPDILEGPVKLRRSLTTRGPEDP